MRLRRLDLIAFGHFTNVSIDLSQGNCGLHIIYGPNEAGKSSSLRALTDWLFGFPPRTSDSFVHPYASLRVGGVLENQRGQVMHCIRRKAQQSSLRDGSDDKPISEAEWNVFLGDVHRDLFLSMFGIHHESLRKGGDEMASGGGKTGETLFASASGWSGLRHTQKKLRDSIDSIYSSTGRKGVLAEKVALLKSIREEQRQVSASSDQFAELERKQKEAEDQRSDLKQRIATANTRIAILDRMLRALPLVAEWIDTSRRAVESSEAVLLPDGFGNEATEYRTRKASLETHKKQAEDELCSLQKQWNAIRHSHPSLNLEQRIGEVQTRFGEYRKGQQDLPRLQSELDREEQAAREILSAMGRSHDLDAIDTLRIPAERQKRIQLLTQSHAALAQRLLLEKQKLEQAERRHRRFTDQVESKDDGNVLRLLRDRIDRTQSLGPIERQLAELKNRIADAERSVATELGRLGITEAASDFSRSVLPKHATLDAMEEALAEIVQEERRIEKDRIATNKKRTQQARLLQRLDSETLIPSRDDLRRSRETRDSAWEKFHDHLPTKSNAAEGKKLSSIFIESMRTVDQLADAMLEHAEQVNKKQQLLIDLEELDGQLQELDQDSQRCSSSRSTWLSQWQSLWVAIGIEPSNPKEMREWLQRAEAAQKSLDSLEFDRAEADRKRMELEASQTSLADSLTELATEGIDRARDLVALVSLAQEVARGIEKATIQSQSIRDQRREAQEQQEEARSDLELALSELKTWNVQWRAEMEGLGLDAQAMPEQALEFTQMNQSLFERWTALTAVRRRIQGIERDADEFLKEAAEVGSLLGRDLEVDGVEVFLAWLSQELQTAIKDRDRSNMLDEQIKRCQQRIAETNHELGIVDARLKIMMEQARCANGSLLVEADIRSQERKKNDSSLKNLRSRIAELAEGEAFDGFVQRVQSCKPEDLRQEMEELAGELEHRTQERDVAVQAVDRYARELVALDHQGQASDLASQAQGIVASIEEQIQELAILRLCASVLHAGIERFREKNQDPLLRSASASFQAMTRGAFSGLRIDLDDAGQGVLVGMRAGQESVYVQNMSDGTRDQLYLALRLAAVQQWNTLHEPIPLIVDDILVHFDDDRSVATLEQLVRMSDRTQVIFFTHHQHLIDLAMNSLDETRVFIHRLEPKFAAELPAAVEDRDGITPYR